MTPEDFYTKPACNTPQRLKLYTIDGADSGEWIEVYGIDSDAYEAALAETQQQLLAIEVTTSVYKTKALEGGSTPTEMEKAANDLLQVSQDRQAILKSRELETKAALVAGWSFKKEFNKANVMELLRNSPAIAQSLDSFITNRLNFLKKK
ncbi:phage tail assembly chaperone [uncultured Endozoicomonas sp.]|uniref:phage tail assembly chaperone n=1 Tax=uncultured Endozoicomonas sp. TaxID=432652 RepID=UPI002639FB54|nr:phage tail assembly chaperone [uncultured Endozoicomonas sp.]